MNEKILLGYGTFTIDGTPVGLTRGGGSFSVEREVREIIADGDRGPVKGRIVIDTEKAMLSLNALETFTLANIKKYFSATVLNTNKLTSALEFDTTDYHTLLWEGKTLDGKQVTITLTNAINLSNIELKLEDKNEVIPELKYTATYEEADRNASTWSIDFPPIVGG